MNKHLTIIIPVLNESEGIEGTLKPLQALRRKGVEVLLCDGGSTDNTVAVAQPLVDQVWSSNPGRAQQMNSGAMIASGEYLLFLHADTQLPENFSNLWQELIQHQPLWGFFAVRLSGVNPLFRLVEHYMNLRSKLTGVGTGDQCLFIKRELFEQLNGYADIPLMEDIEICKRLKQHRRPHLVDQPVLTSSRRWEEHGVLRTILLMWRLRLAYFLGASPDQLVKRYYPKA